MAAVSGSTPPSGSSPRARGTPQRRAPRVHRRRFIPACAGNAAARAETTARAAVHPRVRGERKFKPSCVATSDGSSPRARGTPAAAVLRDTERRFIPACAGNAAARGGAAGGGAVHPRVRGERGCFDAPAQCACGSSPRARGTLGVRQMSTPEVRFIPACAGNAFTSCTYVRPRAVHPRVRGERIGRSVTAACLVGSSPRARGTPCGAPSAPSSSRFIPACAGNAGGPPRCVRASSVHPRVRGERLVCGR